MSIFLLKKIYYCPIKSLSFNELNEAKIIKSIGIEDDRSLAFTRNLNQKNASEYIFNPKIRNLNNFITLRNCPFMKKYNFVLDSKNNLIKLYDNKLKFFDINLKKNHEIKKVQNFIKNLDPKIKNPAYLIQSKKFPFFDTTPNISISMINLNTIKDLELKINKKINFERFRANFYVDGLGPWKEFELLNSYIQIGQVKFKIDSKIPRCSITNINPDNFKMDINLPNLLLNHYGHTDFGIYLTPQNSGIVKKNNYLNIL